MKTTKLPFGCHQVLAFVKSDCEVGDLFCVSKADLFSAYIRWCEKTKPDFSYSSRAFARYLRTALPEIGDTRPKIEASRERMYTGIRVLSTTN